MTGIARPPSELPKASRPECWRDSQAPTGAAEAAPSEPWHHATTLATCRDTN